MTRKIFLAAALSLATMAFVVLWAIGAAFNYQYGLTQGSSEASLFTFITASQLYGCASVAANVAEVTVFTFAMIALQEHKWVRAISAFAVAMIVFGWSAMSIHGSFITEHSRIVDAAGQTSDQWQMLKNQVLTLQKDRAMVPLHRPWKTVEEDIKNTEADDRFEASKQCTDIRNNKTQAFCDRWRSLSGEFASAISARDLDAKLDKASDSMNRTPGVTESDPAAASLASMFGIQKANVLNYRAIWLLVVLTVVPSVGFSIVWTIFFDAVGPHGGGTKVELPSIPHEPPKVVSELTKTWVELPPTVAHDPVKKVAELEPPKPVSSRVASAHTSSNTVVPITRIGILPWNRKRTPEDILDAFIASVKKGGRIGFQEIQTKTTELAQAAGIEPPSHRAIAKLLKNRGIHKVERPRDPSTYLFPEDDSSSASGSAA
jgi:hypothetical protein